MQSNTTELGKLNSSVGLVNTNVNDTLRSRFQENGSKIDENFARNQIVQAEQHQASSSWLLSEIKEFIPAALAEQLASMSLTQTEDDNFIFQGDNLEATMLPILQLRPDLTKAVQTLMSEGSLKLSVSEAKWIQEEFEMLLDRGCEARERNRAKARACSPVQSTSISGISRKRKIPTEVAGVSKHFKSSRATDSRERRCFRTAFGDLHIRGARENGEGDSSSLGIHVSFLPKIRLCSIAMRISLFKACGTHMEPQINRLIQTSNIIPNNSKAMICVENNDVVGLKELFDNGEASPNDCNEFGHTLIMVKSLKAPAVNNY